RFVLAWQITPEWKYEPDLGRSSEVEVTFTPAEDGSTRVDLEHRRFDRYGDGASVMRKGVDSEGGWGSLLRLFAEAAERQTSEEPDYDGYTPVDWTPKGRLHRHLERPARDVDSRQPDSQGQRGHPRLARRRQPPHRGREER